ncbi:MAG: hypothetical protein ACI4UN_04250 [Muribaculaceae bacterium]
MKDSNTYQNDERLDALIQRYFDAETTLEEEAELRRAVAHREEPKYDEIRAVMGYFAAKRAEREAAVVPLEAVSRRRFLWLRAVAAAAVVALVATVGINLMQQRAESNTCYAVVGGVRIDDEAQVLSLMQSNLCDIGAAASEADASVQSQMADIGSFIDEVE